MMNTAYLLETIQMTTTETLHQCNLPKEVRAWFKAYAKENGKLAKEVYVDAVVLFSKKREAQLSSVGYMLYYTPTKASVLQNVHLDENYTSQVVEMARQDDISVRILLHTALMRFYIQKSSVAKPPRV